jgi:hypothetical protein
LADHYPPSAIHYLAGTFFAISRPVRAAVLLVFLLSVTTCDENSPVGPTVQLNERFTLAPGETAFVDGQGLRVQFVQVTGDSRCPADAVCIQGGDAIVRVRVVDEANTTAVHELHTGDSSRASVIVAGTRIELIDLQPYPFSSRTTAPGDYRATLTVTAP